MDKLKFWKPKGPQKKGPAPDKTRKLNRDERRLITRDDSVTMTLAKKTDKDGRMKVKKLKIAKRRVNTGCLCCRVVSFSAERLQFFSSIGAFVSLLCALADVILLFGLDWDRSLPLYSVANVYRTTNATGHELSEGSTIQVQLVHEGDVSLGLALLLTALLDATFMLMPTVWKGYDYARKLDEGVNPLQLVQFSLSASTAFVAILLVTGAHDVMSLSSGVVLTMATMLFGHLAEEINAQPRVARRKRLVFAAHIGGWFCQLGAWLMVLASFAESISLSDEWPPFFVFLIIAGMGGAYAYFGVAQALFLFLPGTSRRCISSLDIFMSPACKLYLHVILFSYVFAP